MFNCTQQCSTSTSEDVFGANSAMCSCDCLNRAAVNSSSSSSCFIPIKQNCIVESTTRKLPPNIQNEVNVAKSIMKQCSSISGDNLFDHLCDVIKGVIDQKPSNVIDFFEEYSRNIREQKFRLDENASRNLNIQQKSFLIAREILATLKLPKSLLDYEFCEEEDEGEGEKQLSTAESSDNFDAFGNERLLIMNENILHMQFLWSLCGFGFNVEEIYQLSIAMQKLQSHQTIINVRFWGKIFGLQKSYYIVEVDLQQFEIERRQKIFRDEMIQNISEYYRLKDVETVINNCDLIPGKNWHHMPVDELHRMKKAEKSSFNLPNSNVEAEYDIPPEAIGNGLNRKTYFVINTLRDEWTELPIVTPKQVTMAKSTKKYFSGDLESEMSCYPRFPGCEKHYLRATIARITSGTYIAPKGYYRVEKDTKMFEEEQEEMGDEDGNEGPLKDNDALIVPDLTYKSMNASDLKNSKNWVHIRPNILQQGRVKFIDAKKAHEDWNRQMRNHNGLTVNEDEEEEVEEEEEDEEDDQEIKHAPETGPTLFTSCMGTSEENLPCWVSRSSSSNYQRNRIIIMRSNIWPGAFSFSFDKVCDSIYLGWGHKFTARNFSPLHIRPIENEYAVTVSVSEVLDPTVAEEEEWRLTHLKPEKVDIGEENESEDEFND